MDNNPIALVDPEGLLGGDPIETRLGGGGGKSSTTGDPAAQQGTDNGIFSAYFAGGDLPLNSRGATVPPPPQIDQSKLSNQGDYDASKYSFVYEERNEWAETGPLGGYYYKVFYDGEYIGEISIDAKDFDKKPNLLKRYLKGEIDKPGLALKVYIEDTGGADPRLEALVQSSNYKAAALSKTEIVGSSLMEGMSNLSSLAAKKGLGTNKKVIEKTNNQTQGKRIVNITDQQLQKKYKHAGDFGLKGNYNKGNATKYKEAINNHINDKATQVINGTYKGQPVIHYYNRGTGVDVIVSPSGEFISGWKLGPGQQQGVLKNGTLW